MDLLASFCSSVFAAAAMVGRQPPGRLMLGSFTYHYARVGGHNLLQPLYVASGTKNGGGNYPPRASNYPPNGENQSIWKLYGTSQKLSSSLGDKSSASSDMSRISSASFGIQII
jgi:hypothetical protein